MTDNNENARAERPRGNTSRRRFLQGTAGAFGAALASPGLYKMADAIAAPPARPAAAPATLQEQYLLQDTQVVNVDGSGLQSKHGSVAVHVPPCTTMSLRRS